MCAWSNCKLDQLKQAPDTAPLDWDEHGPWGLGSMQGRGLVLSVFEGNSLLFQDDLTYRGKTRLTFGSADNNDIVISSRSGIVSHHHGSFVIDGLRCTVVDEGSTNGLYVNGAKRSHALLLPGDAVTIGIHGKGSYETITMMVDYDDSRWLSCDISKRTRVTMGRAADNDVVLNLPSVSAYHAQLIQGEHGGWHVLDRGSFNGTFVGHSPVIGSLPLSPGDTIALAGATCVFTGDSLLYSVKNQGVDIVARNLMQVRKTRHGSKVTTDNVSLHIGKGEFVAIVGGSGAGKSTLLNALNGSDPATSGTVSVDGVDLYANYNVLKNAIGYVPQQDIVYDNLTLTEMLGYAAELRMPPDTSKEERAARAREVIEILELAEVAGQRIGNMSGGQKKRASIAVEMLADPRLFFLDEPTSGLDPGIEKSLMRKLSSLAHAGRTIILVTHTTLNLSECDKVVFMAPGGVLAYAGPPAKALDYFGVEDFVDIYELASHDPAGWGGRFAAQGRSASIDGCPPSSDVRPCKQKSPSFFKQLSTLSRRYARLVLNDRMRLLLLLGQAPALAALICMVAGEGCFSVYENTKSCLFALACAAFWIGILDSIQEICKERVILKREYSGGLRLGAYVSSKVVVLGGMCVAQSALLTIVFCLMEGLPSEALLDAGLEMYATVLLTMLSAMFLGLLVSALFKNPDRAIAVAPILIMPQILFSGLIFKLEGMAESISVLVNCRWGMEAFGTSANLNSLDLNIYESEFIDSSLYAHEWEAAFDYTVAHLLCSWEILCVFCLVCALVCGLVLKIGIKK